MFKAQFDAMARYNAFASHRRYDAADSAGEAAP